MEHLTCDTCKRSVRADETITEIDEGIWKCMDQGTRHETDYGLMSGIYQ